MVVYRPPRDIGDGYSYMKLGVQRSLGMSSSSRWPSWETHARSRVADRDSARQTVTWPAFGLVVSRHRHGAVTKIVAGRQKSSIGSEIECEPAGRQLPPNPPRRGRRPVRPGTISEEILAATSAFGPRSGRPNSRSRRRQRSLSAAALVLSEPGAVRRSKPELGRRQCGRTARRRLRSTRRIGDRNDLTHTLKRETRDRAPLDEVGDLKKGDADCPGPARSHRGCIRRAG